MTSLDYQPPPLPPTMRPAVPVTAIIAWVIVGFLAVIIPILNHVGQRYDPESAAPQPGRVDVAFQMSGQYILGAARNLPDSKEELIKTLESQAQTPSQKEAAHILRRAATELPATTQPATQPTTQPTFFDSGDNLDLAAHPWFAALRSPGPERDAALKKADRMFVIVLVLTFAGLLILAIGVALGVTAIILLATRWLQPQYVRPQGPVGVYIEAFALYLVLFLGGSIAVSLLLPDVPMVAKVLPLGVLVLFAAAWPLIRGVTWQTYSRNVGLHAGKGVFTEIGTGIVGYLACLPLLGISLLFVMLLQKFAQQQTSHPIVNEIGQGNPLGLLILAAVFAPIAEEVMFRGLLHTHLRRRLGIFLSALISGLIFAAIHPQGWIAIPTLLTIACILSLLREWRGSLIAPTTAHAMNNGVVVTMLIIVSRL